MTREEIEQLWVEESTKRRYGIPLCRFMMEVGNRNLTRKWNKIWGNQKCAYIDDYFDED